jgi:hypothetical protein
MKKITQNVIKYAILALIFTVSTYAYAAWSEPAGAPPAGNPDAPVNVASTSQTKEGFLWTGGFGSTAGGYFATTLGVATTTNPSLTGEGLVALFGGKVGASQYCDQNGGSCATASSLSSGNIPTGAVMAFDLTSCPTGWTEYTSAQGRNIIGKNATYPYQSTGGAATEVINTSELPSHAHAQSGTVNVNASYSANGDNIGSGTQVAGPVYSGKTRLTATLSGNTGATGGGNAIPIMDPYIALLYCKKS